MKSKRPPDPANVPWITTEGTLDCSQFPIEVPIRQCIDPASEAFGHGCRFLATMASAGRVDAGIFLLGLLRYCEEDLTAAGTVVESLSAFHDPRCATALFCEFRRVASSNKTRRYLDTVLRALIRLPADMVQERLSELSSDTAFSYKMRAKFRDAAEAMAHHW